QQHHQPGQGGADQPFEADAPDGPGDVGRLVELEVDADVLGDDGLHVRQFFLDLVDHRQGGGVGPLGDQDVDRALAVDEPVAGGDVGGGVDHPGDVADVDGRVGAEADRDVLQGLDVVPHHRVDRHHRRLAVDGDVAGRGDLVAAGNGGDHLVGRQVVLLELLGVGAEDDGALVAAERRRARDAGQAGGRGPDSIEREVLNLADALGPALEDEIANGNAPGVKAHDERRHGPRRHERAGAVDVADRFGHGLGHVGARMEVELHQGDALDILTLDMVNAGYVEEVILVVVGQKA